ncbi:hypothetical protein QR680_011832 [Steinernema hermaphroditum]|uniref:SANTA domain-containing protein n=1 Tax=Steinernema hermaphroditum TaxID=289476 RepID=A0AA39I2D5_9BILA|nr:hypothetical protein QR680_011832 [Steinernema hermaphroditum]
MGKEVILRYWSPVVSRSPFQVKVEGFLVDTKTLFSEKKKLYRSSAIVEAIGPRELASKHGTVYVLDGPADLRRCQSIGMPEPLVEQFEMGFPKKYEELLKEWIYPKPKQPEVRDMNYTVEEPDEDDDVRHNNHNHAAKKKHQSSTVFQRISVSDMAAAGPSHERKNNARDCWNDDYNNCNQSMPKVHQSSTPFRHISVSQMTAAGRSHDKRNSIRNWFDQENIHSPIRSDGWSDDE